MSIKILELLEESKLRKSRKLFCISNHGIKLDFKTFIYEKEETKGVALEVLLFEQK